MLSCDSYVVIGPFCQAIGEIRKMRSASYFLLLSYKKSLSCFTFPGGCSKIAILEGRVKDLQSQNGFLIQDHTRISGQLDRLLAPSQEEQKEKSKKWFEFWKR